MRRALSTKTRVKIFQDAGGKCDICGGLIQVGQKWEVSHRIPLALGGADDESNWFPAHAVCHRSQTADIDQPAIGKARRREARHLGIKKPRTITAWRAFDGSIRRAPRER